MARGPWKKQDQDSEKSNDPNRAAELARRAQFENVKSATPSNKIEEGSTTPGRGYVEPAK